MEIERKFLLSGFPDLPELERAEVFQGYLGISPEVRIRSKRVGEREHDRAGFRQGRSDGLPFGWRAAVEGIDADIAAARPRLPQFGSHV